MWLNLAELKNQTKKIIMKTKQKSTVVNAKWMKNKV